MAARGSRRALSRRTAGAWLWLRKVTPAPECKGDGGSLEVRRFGEDAQWSRWDVLKFQSKALGLKWKGGSE